MSHPRNHFNDVPQFTLSEVANIVKEARLNVKNPSIRARIYEGIDKGFFERVGKGVYSVKKTDAKGKTNTCLLINGDGRYLSMLEDNSVDCIITDHPYKL